MREILFKAKRIDNEEWISGSLVIKKDTGNDAVNCYIIRPMFILATHIQLVYTEVDPETICEFTGLKDKNGNKIFENDIVKIQIDNNTDNEEFICEVQYSHLAFDFRRINGNEDKGCVVFARTVMPPNNYEIMGNKFDNPELLGNAEKVEK